MPKYALKLWEKCGHLEATEQQAVVKANPYLLKIALKNIIDNACKSVSYTHL